MREMETAQSSCNNNGDHEAADKAPLGASQTVAGSRPEASMAIATADGKEESAAAAAATAAAADVVVVPGGPAVALQAAASLVLPWPTGKTLAPAPSSTAAPDSAAAGATTHVPAAQPTLQTTPPVAHFLAAHTAAALLSTTFAGLTQPAVEPEPEPTEDAEELFCFCRQPYSEDGDPMIECETCEEWYHFKCVNLTPAKAKKIKVYLCRACETPAPAAASYWSGQIEATAVQPRARRTVLDDGGSKSTVQPATAQPTHTHPTYTRAQPPHAQPTPAPPTMRTAPAPPTSAPPRARAAPAQPTTAQPTRTSTQPTSAQFGSRNRKRRSEPLDGEETAPNGDQLLGPTSNTVGTVAVVATGEFKFPMLPTTTVIICALLGLLLVLLLSPCRVRALSVLASAAVCRYPALACALAGRPCV